MTRDQVRGQEALQTLDRYTEPQSIFVGADAGKLYSLENKRSDVMSACAKEWSKVAGVTEKDYWTRAIPQMLHDVLENYQLECGLIAAEAFLKRHGWTIIRPEAKL